LGLRPRRGLGASGPEGAFGPQAQQGSWGLRPIGSSCFAKNHTTTAHNILTSRTRRRLALCAIFQPHNPKTQNKLMSVGHLCITISNVFHCHPSGMSTTYRLTCTHIYRVSVYFIIIHAHKPVSHTQTSLCPAWSQLLSGPPEACRPTCELATSIHTIRTMQPMVTQVTR